MESTGVGLTKGDDPSAGVRIKQSDVTLLDRDAELTSQPLIAGASRPAFRVWTLLPLSLR
ncbi:hypothetical protein FRUB_07989 [Fimbriiglobus ruber]|uniref:Uncharacterized protein n=1 Tax=Fimbriiglobus ruber TaxID=1908690 RepID=A0A225DDL7_9BACT|nr:hypothetical protein FRUB_07989 [Fimbriiglobus ruber]